MGLPTGPGSLATVPNSPFTDFIDIQALNFESETPPSDVTKALVAALSAGYWQSASATPGNQFPGLTACGLYGLLQMARESLLPEVAIFNLINSDFSNKDYVYDLDTQAFIFKNPQGFIGYLNAIHNNINAIIRNYLPSSPDSQGFGRTDAAYAQQELQATANNTNRNRFLFLRDIFLPGSYTGNTGGVLPEDELTGEVDFKGGGITGAFVVYDNTNSQYTLSRTGIEFYTVLNYLSYGGIACVGGDYSFLDTRMSAPLQPGADVIMTLDMASYLDAQGITTGNNRAVYGALPYSYASGNTYNFCHGSSADFLNNSYANVVRRNNIFNALLDTGNAARENFVIIHSGLSGSDFSLAQNSTTGTYSDVNRYPGLDGRSSLYQNIPNVAGLTAYVLNGAALNKTFCIIGLKTKTIATNNFGQDGTLQITIPLISDVAGAMHRAKVAGNVYIAATGSNLASVLNVDTITPAAPSSSWEYSDTLKRKRINYYQAGVGSGYYLASDYVGVTGAYTANNRVGVPSLIQQVKTIAENAIAQYVDAAISNTATWAAARTSVINALNNAGSNLSNALDTTGTRSFDSPGIVVCDSTNNTPTSGTLRVDIKIYPKQTFTSNPGTAVNGFLVTVTAQE
jgi:hypothetical protein